MDGVNGVRHSGSSRSSSSSSSVEEVNIPEALQSSRLDHLLEKLNDLDSSVLQWSNAQLDVENLKKPQISTELRAKLAFKMSKQCNIYLAGDTCIAYHNLFLKIAYELGHPKAAYRLAKQAHDPAEEMKWYRRVSNVSTKCYRVAQERIAIFEQIRSALGERYNDAITPEQNLHQASQGNYLPPHQIVFSNVCFSFSTTETVCLGEDIILERCRVRRGAVQFRSGELGAVKAGAKSIADGKQALSYSTPRLHNWDDAIAEAVNGGVAISSLDYQFVKDFFYQNFGQEIDNTRRAELIFLMGCKLEEHKHYEGAKKLWKNAYALGNHDAAYKLASYLLRSGDPSEEIEAMLLYRTVLEGRYSEYAKLKCDSYIQIKEWLGDAYDPSLYMSANICAALARGLIDQQAEVHLFDWDLGFLSSSHCMDISSKIFVDQCRLLGGGVRFHHGVLFVCKGATAISETPAALACAIEEGAQVSGIVTIDYQYYRMVKADLESLYSTDQTPQVRADAAYSMAEYFKKTGNRATFRYMCEAAHELGHLEAMHLLAKTTMERGDYWGAIDCFEQVPVASTYFQEAQKMVAQAKNAQATATSAQPEKHILIGWNFKLEQPMPSWVVLQTCRLQSGSRLLHEGDLCATTANANIIVAGPKAIAVAGHKQAKVQAQKIQLWDTKGKVIPYENFEKIPSFTVFYGFNNTLQERATAARVIGEAYFEGKCEGMNLHHQSDTISHYFLKCAFDWGEKDAGLFLGKWYLKQGKDNEARAYFEQVPDTNPAYYARAQAALEKESSPSVLSKFWDSWKSPMPVLVGQGQDKATSSSDDGL